MMGMSPTNGTRTFEPCWLSSNNPAIASHCPTRKSTVVFTDRLVDAGDAVDGVAPVDRAQGMSALLAPMPEDLTGLGARSGLGPDRATAHPGRPGVRRRPGAGDRGSRHGRRDGGAAGGPRRPAVAAIRDVDVGRREPRRGGDGEHRGRAGRRLGRAGRRGTTRAWDAPGCKLRWRPCAMAGRCDHRAERRASGRAGHSADVIQVQPDAAALGPLAEQAVAGTSRSGSPLPSRWRNSAGAMGWPAAA